MDMAPEKSLEQMVQEGVEERKRQLRRHKLPEKATLASMLTAMTKAELDDIRFNLNVTGASSLKKAELVERLCPAITAFSERWMMSLLEEEYQLFRDLAANGGRRLFLAARPRAFGAEDVVIARDAVDHAVIAIVGEEEAFRE